jgi:hypothetical protein
MVFNEFIKSTKDNVNIGVQFLPLFTGSSLLTIGTATANYSFLYLFIGMYVLLPLIMIVLDTVTIGKFTTYLFSRSESIFPIVESTGAGAGAGAGLSYGYAMMIFFFSYLITNAAYLIRSNEDSVVRGRASIAILIVLLSALAYIFLKIKNMGKIAESPLGLALIGLGAVGLGYSWYYLLYSCNKSSLADVFGVENNVAVSKSNNTVCVAFSS